jgi:hypothetical protein
LAGVAPAIAPAARTRDHRPRGLVPVREPVAAPIPVLSPSYTIDQPSDLVERSSPWGQRDRPHNSADTGCGPRVSVSRGLRRGAACDHGSESAASQAFQAKAPKACLEVTRPLHYDFLIDVTMAVVLPFAFYLAESCHILVNRAIFATASWSAPGFVTTGRRAHSGISPYHAIQRRTFSYRPRTGLHFAGGFVPQSF